MDIKTAMKILRDSDSFDERLHYLTWCLAWAFLDQRIVREKKRYGRQHFANQAARALYQRQLDKMLRRLIRPEYRLKPEDTSLIRAFLQIGGPIKFMKGESTRTMVERFGSHMRDYDAVFRMMTHLCRASLESKSRKFLTIDLAKQLLSKSRPAIAPDTAENIWRSFARGAPLIFAAYKLRTDETADKVKLSDAVQFLTRIAKSKEQTTRFIGYVAFAAEALRHLKNTKAFTNSFKRIPALIPLDMQPLSKDELSIIESLKTRHKN